MEQIPLTEKSSASCGCGCAHEDGAPELDVRAIPHAIRHATVFGALGAIKPGQSMVLVAPHDPVPLLAQIAERHGDDIAVDYVQRGPEAWKLKLAKRA